MYGIDQQFSYLRCVASNSQLQIATVANDIVFCTRMDGPHGNDRRFGWLHFAAHDRLQTHHQLSRLNNRIDGGIRGCPVTATPNPSFRRVDAEVFNGDKSDRSVIKLSTIVGRF